MYCKVDVKVCLWAGLCLVPLLRSRDNITLPVVGEPCSPEDKVRLRAPSSPSLTHSPQEPSRTLSAYAGPMSPSKVGVCRCGLCVCVCGWGWHKVINVNLCVGKKARSRRCWYDVHLVYEKGNDCQCQCQRPQLYSAAFTPYL